MGRAGYRAYWLRFGAAFIALAVVSIPVWYLRAESAAKYGTNIVLIAAVAVPAVLVVAAALIWLSGLSVWMLARRLSRENPGAVFFFSQKSLELESVLHALGRAGDSSGFYCLLMVGREKVDLYLGGRRVVSVPIGQVKSARASTTSVRGLELPCVEIAMSSHGVSVDLPIQPARTPWAALLPTSPSGTARYSEELKRLLGQTETE